MKSIAFSINSKIGFIFLAIGIIITAVLTFWAGMILFVFLLFIGSLELFFEYREYEVRPSMTYRGSAISAVAYIAIIAALWTLMSYTSHIPEVDIAMRFFMS